MHKIFMMLLNIPLCFMFTFLVNNHNIKARLKQHLSFIVQEVQRPPTHLRQILFQTL